MNKSVLVVGANGGIGQALVQRLLGQHDVARVYGISRGISTIQDDKYCHIQCSQLGYEDIEGSLEGVPNHSLSLIICCIGALHQSSTDLVPEKKLEDLREQQLSQYFHINCILPALWLRALESKMIKKSRSQMVFLSARVGSTSDNRLGGWYGYRASKAALNSLIKSAQIELRRRHPGCELVLYHPGTVDTSLSKPFQKNVPAEKLFTAEFTSQQLLKHLTTLSSEDAPHYIDWQGQTIPW